jgi:TnpA family transposase
LACLTEGVSYQRIKRVSDGQFTEESQRAALAELVGAINRLGTSHVGGEGKTSSSDGQRFHFPRRVLQQTFSHKMSDFALEFYSFVADNYAPFYSTPIECTDREAPFVLDGLLDNETELPLEEHYSGPLSGTTCCCTASTSSTEASSASPSVHFRSNRVSTLITAIGDETEDNQHPQGVWAR